MAFSSFTSSLPSRRRRLAVGSFIEEFNNRVDILSFDEDTLTHKLVPNLSFEHPYPPTKLMFHPNPSASLKTNDILASSGDYLRLWDVEPRRIGTSSIDTTCTIWDVEKGVVETQLIAHDKEVYDIAWGEAGFLLRIFDLRDKEHSTIIYESPKPDTPLLRLAWNKQDLRYMATILMDNNKIVILDIRSPAIPVAELERHQASVNAITWAPQSCRHICSAGDDGQALIWELPTVAGPNGIDPMSMYSAGAEINQIQWSAAQRDWIAIAFSNKLQLLKV
ncbi:hypothetical protein H5410_017197 [Solanum commersonii]|uniref:Uncharacterized protein n=1 Tax=Solanum commersonii TaxID=4109 RepID=A0A9J5ZYG6_SOLCO|nr:hypothetical protein H5410_017197 [Solanum commersonii]